MKGFAQNALRRFTRIMRPLALKSAGKEGSGTAVIRHTGRQSGRVYETPVVAARNGEFFLVALPYGERTDWLRNVLSKGSAVIVTGGRAFEIDQPEVIPMTEATAYFRPREQRMQSQFRVASALRIRQQPQPVPKD
jgi:deazaflavin-dependent oxidoreductase (nitroreductase family)